MTSEAQQLRQGPRRAQDLRWILQRKSRRQRGEQSIQTEPGSNRERQRGARLETQRGQAAEARGPEGNAETGRAFPNRWPTRAAGSTTAELTLSSGPSACCGSFPCPGCVSSLLFGTAVRFQHLPLRL